MMLPYTTEQNVRDIIADVYPDTNKLFSKLTKVDDYLYVAEYRTDKLNYAYAFKYFREEQDDITNVFGCSGVRNGNWLGRNYDWIYDDTAEFVIRVPNAKYPSIGVAAKPGLTNEIAATGAYNNYYRILPFFTLDGINTAGVFVHTNVVPLDNEPTSADVVPGKLNICAMMLPRYILDNFGSAQEAKTAIETGMHIYMPKHLQAVNYELHMTVGDATNTYIVEVINNEIVVKDATNALEVKPILTNFYVNNVTFNADGSVYTPATQDNSHDAMTTNHITKFGCGLERYNILNAGYSTANTLAGMTNLMKSVRSTKTYTITEADDVWYTEFTGADIDPEDEESEKLQVNSAVNDFENAVEQGREMYENRSRDPEDENYGTWQTVHTSVYDIANKQLHIYVQESDTEHVYSLEEFCTSETVDQKIEAAITNRLEASY